MRNSDSSAINSFFIRLLIWATRNCQRDGDSAMRSYTSKGGMYADPDIAGPHWGGRAVHSDGDGVLKPVADHVGGIGDFERPSPPPRVQPDTAGKVEIVALLQA